MNIQNKMRLVEKKRTQSWQEEEEVVVNVTKTQHMKFLKKKKLKINLKTRSKAIKSNKTHLFTYALFWF